MSKKTKILLPCIIAVVVIGAFLVALAMNSSIDKTELSSLLTKYFEAYYTTANVNAIKECVPPEIQEEADLAYTLGGSVNLLTSYMTDTISQVGEDPEVTVTLTAVSDPSATLRNEYKTQFAGVSMSVGADFEVSIKGSESTLNFTGTADFVKTNDGWYITSYSIPLYEK